MNKVKLYIFLAVLLPGTAFSFGTHENDTLREQYVESYPDKFYVKPIFTISDLHLELRDEDLENSINYLSNASSYVGFGIFLFNAIALKVKASLPKSSDRVLQYGETEVLDIQPYLYLKSWMGRIIYQRYKGFYLADPENVIETWTNDQPHPQRPDLRISNTSVEAYYLFNGEKFSYRSSYNLIDRQLKSSGSWMLGASFVNYEISADSTLIPPSVKEEFNSVSLSRAEFISFGILPGYTYNFILKNFYLNLTLLAGPTYVRSEYNNLLMANTVERDIQTTVNIRAALGYNSPKWFVGMTLSNARNILDSDPINVLGDSGNLEFFVGYRFKQVGFLKEKINIF